MPTPLYQTLYEHFRDAILSGELKPNTRLPSSRLLSQQRGCSRNTVNQAYEMLIAEGYAEPRPGSGTYVTPTLPDTFHLPSSSSSSSSSSSKNTIATSPPNRPPHPRQFTTSSSSDAQYRLPLPLSHGVPDLESFPRETWLKLYNRYLRKSPYSLIHYGHPQGYLPLRQAIATYLNTHRGARCDPSQILIVSGSQHGLDLVARTLLHPKDKVWLESPTYLGAHTSFKQTNAKLLPIPVEEDGMNVPWAIDALSKPDLIYTTPSHQFPIGCTLSLSKRLQLLDYASNTGAWILEDDYDADFRYNGHPIPCMQGMPNNERVVYLGTFSKSMFTDIRSGYLVLPPNLIDDFVYNWSNGAANPPIAMQAALTSFIEEGHYHRHIRRMRKKYAAKNQYLIDCIQKYLPNSFDLGPTDCGLHLAAYTKTKKEYNRLQKEAEANKIHLSPISKYDLLENHRLGFILGFSCYSEESIETALSKLIQ